MRMFALKRCGRCRLQPLLGHICPYRPGLAPWPPETGDLLDLRNRWGLLSPQSVRFCNHELGDEERPLYPEENNVVEYMQGVYNKSVDQHRPYFRDPYDRDGHSRRVQLMVNCKKIPGVPHQHPAGVSSQGTSDELWDMMKMGNRPRGNPARVKQLKRAMEEAADRKREEQQAEAMMWGYSEKDTVRKACTVSPHLYKPKCATPKSEWTAKMEASRAESRKKDINSESQRRGEAHLMHSDIVRLNKSSKDAAEYAKMKTNIAERDDKLEKFMAKKNAEKYM